MTSAPPGNTVASFTRNDEAPPDFTNLADTVMFELTMLASDKPMMVCVAPDATVSVTVVELADKPMLADAFDLNAIYYPNAIAIAVA